MPCRRPLLSLTTAPVRSIPPWHKKQVMAEKTALAAEENAPGSVAAS